MNANTQDILDTFKEMYTLNMFNEAGLLEIVGASFIADTQTILGTLDLDYAKKEIAWYLSKSRNVNDIHNTPKIWSNIAAKDGTINSNYGWCIFSDENYTQYFNVLQTLQKNRNSRQGCMIYNRPSMHIDSNVDGMQDFMCTNAVNYYIRDNKLHCVVQMRSNDVVYGYKNDRYWQMYVLERLAQDLQVEVGKIMWQVGSLHIYPRHFYLLEDYIKNKSL